MHEVCKFLLFHMCPCTQADELLCARFISAHCGCSSQASESALRPPPPLTYVRTGHCDKENRIIYFLDETKPLTTEDGMCLVPLQPVCGPTCPGLAAVRNGQ